MITQVQEFVECQNSTPLNWEQYRSSAGNPPSCNLPADDSTPKREPIKHLLIGSAKTVTSTIHYLQMLGYASVGDWSPLLPTGNPDEAMSILVRQIVS